MKKMLCILLAALLLVSIGTPALAEGNDAEENDPLVFDKPDIGFHFVTPEKYRNLKGSLDWGSHYLDDGLLQIQLSYYCFPPEDFDAYNDFVNAYFNAVLAGEDPPEPADPRWSTGMECDYLYDIFIITGFNRQITAAIRIVPPTENSLIPLIHIALSDKYCALVSDFMPAGVLITRLLFGITASSSAHITHPIFLEKTCYRQQSASGIVPAMRRGICHRR